MRNDKMELKLSQVIRKNLTIRSLSMILGEMVTELQQESDLKIYTSDFEEIQTLLDCVLDESNINDRDLSEFQEYFESLNLTSTNLSKLKMSEITDVEKVLKLPEMSLYSAIQEVRAKRNNGGKE